MAENWEIDIEAMHFLLRGPEITTYISAKVLEIANNVQAQAVRTGDNSPRRVRPSSKRAGMGYEHYEDDIDTHVTVADRVTTGYVFANRHAMVLEFGWTDSKGRFHPPRAYMRKALRMAVDYS